MPENLIGQLARAVGNLAGQLPEDTASLAGGYNVLEVEPPNGPGEVFEVEDPEYPYVKVYQVVRRVPGVSRCTWRRVGIVGGKVFWHRTPHARFLCKLVDMRRTD
jgi:hypothetical protein